MHHEAKVRIDLRKDSLKREIAFLRAMQKMREEMDRVWKDFFEKNPGEKEDVARRWVEERWRKLTKFEGSARGSSDHGQKRIEEEVEERI
jgi:hypothetical protein